MLLTMSLQATSLEVSLSRKHRQLQLGTEPQTVGWRLKNGVQS
jgi:hypothetical protein